jgi:hypothetical protein
MAQLYANENIPLPVVEELRRLEHDVLTTFESGRAGTAIPDEQVLAFSVAEKRILLTINRRLFIRLHSLNPDHAGIIVCTFDLDCAALARRIHDALAVQPDITGHLIRINRPG